VSIADELHRLQELHQSGALTEEEFARAKAAVLANASAAVPQAEEAPSPGAEIKDQLDAIGRRQEADMIDREWQGQREQYMMTRTESGTWVGNRHVAGYPVRYLPTRANSLVFGTMAVVGGIIFTAFGGAVGGGLFAAFGVLFTVFAAGWAAYSYSRAVAYERAHSNYLYRRRRALSGGARSPEPKGPPVELDWRSELPPSAEERRP